MTQNVWIAGVGMTRFGVLIGQSVKQLVAESVTQACKDASADLSNIECAFFGTASQGLLEGQTSIPGEIALRAMGIQGIPVYNIENACATGASAFNLAVAQIRAGLADVVLAVGAEKMNVNDSARTMKLFDGAFDVGDRGGLDEVLTNLGGQEGGEVTGRRSIFMDIYAAMARNHMRQFESTQEQLAAIAAKNHVHSTENPRAHFQRAMTIEEVLAARPLSYPLTVPMCSPVTDGSSAVILCSDEGLRRLGAIRPVKVLASVIQTGTDRDYTVLGGHLSARAAHLAYERAGVEPKDVDVAEVHDATAFGELVQSELLGFFEPGEGGTAALRGETTIGGRIPINPSGGLESKGHPIGATGLAQIFELTQQLRGESGARQVNNARIALAENGGGFHRGEEAVTSIILLGRN